MKRLEVQYRRGFTALLASLAIALLPSMAGAGGAGASARCYRSDDATPCLIGIAKAKLGRIADPNERADALGDLLYTLATTGSEDASLVGQARTLADDRAVKPVKQMDLLYSVDIADSIAAPPSGSSYRAALARFAALERELKGIALVELHFNACSIINWDEPFRERWLDFAQSVCRPDRLTKIKADEVASQALLLAMMPIAMTLAEDREGFATSAEAASAWLAAAEAATAKSKEASRHDFAAAVGVLFHTTHAACLDAFDEPDAADAETDKAVRSLRRSEARHGISGKTAPLRRQVVQSLFDAGRDAEAAKLLRRMLSRIDADPSGKTIPLAEQVAILTLAARLESYVNAERDQDQVPAGHIRM